MSAIQASTPLRVWFGEWTFEGQALCQFGYLTCEGAVCTLMTWNTQCTSSSIPFVWSAWLTQNHPSYSEAVQFSAGPQVISQTCRKTLLSSCLQSRGNVDSVFQDEKAGIWPGAPRAWTGVRKLILVQQLTLLWRKERQEDHHSHPANPVDCKSICWSASGPCSGWARRSWICTGHPVALLSDKRSKRCTFGLVRRRNCKK